MKLWPWKGRVAVKKRGFKEKKRTKKEEAAFQEQKAKDWRNSCIRFRTNYVRDAIFLISQATHRLQSAEQYFDCSQNPDFDDLNHNIAYARSFIEFALEQLEEISDRDYEFGVHPLQRRERMAAELKAATKKEAKNGRGKRSRSSSKKRAKGKKG
jgi:hypothetical protein